MSSYLNKNLKINKKPTNTVELDSLVLEEINTINNNNNVVIIGWLWFKYTKI